MNKSFCLSIALALSAFPAAQARDEIRIVGSAGALPFTYLVAERFAAMAEYPAPSLELTGAGIGFQSLCRGIGFEYPDINITSRPITEAELAECQANGVSTIAEIAIGREVVVMVNRLDAERYDLTRAQLFQALAERLVIDGELIDNPHTQWHDLGAELPKTPIQVLGMLPSSAAYTAFLDLVLEAGCESFPAIRALPDEQRIPVCRTPRSDAAFEPGPRDEEILVRQLQKQPATLGIVGYAVLHENTDVLAGNAIEGVVPTEANIRSGRYVLSRPVYLYVKTQHVKSVPGLEEFLFEFVQEHTISPSGYLAEKGFASLDDRGRNRAREGVLRLTLAAQ